MSAMSRRIARAEVLELQLSCELSRLGYWAVRPRKEAHHDTSAPVWTIPTSVEVTRAPDILVLNHAVIELKESLVREGRVTLHTHQLRDYVANWPYLPLPAWLWICASYGAYEGDVGAIDLETITQYDLQRDEIHLPIMRLAHVGRYGQGFALKGDVVSRLIGPPPPSRTL